MNMQDIKSNLKEMANFKGMKTRSEYWASLGKTFLVQVIVVVVGICSIMTLAPIIPFISMVMSLVTFAVVIYTSVVITSTAAARARDAGWNAWWAASLFVPYLGYVAVIVLGCIPTDPEQRFWADAQKAADNINRT
jgi:uncharacterized membrane protein YhaH (DUF805 family)